MFEFAHVNLVANDWQRLARFYREVFQCTEHPPERHLTGAWIERAVNIPGARIDGMHLLLPPAGGAGITIEIFQYNTPAHESPKTANRPGFGHIAFRTDDVAAAVESVLRHGGSRVGTTETRTIDGAGTITFAYVADPEGNIIELQKWF